MHKKRTCIFLFLLLLSGFRGTAQQWNADAGIVVPYKAEVIVSSGTNKAFITDGKPGTYWQSDNPLPGKWIKRLGLNLALNPDNFTLSPKGDYYAAFDGNTDTKTEITNGYLEMNFTESRRIKLLAVKLNGTDTVFVDSYHSGSLTGIIKIAPSENYRVLFFKGLGNLDQLVFRSTHRFSLFEAALMDTLPYEYVIFDFGGKKEIGRIAGRWFNENILSIEVFYSVNGKSWKFLRNLNPDAVAFTHIPLKKSIIARYIKVLFTLPVENYRKARLWEMAFYDRYGPYGKPPEAKPSALTWSETFGINTVWGWGYSVYSDRLPKGTGPELFIRTAKQVRCYHRIDWDVNRPQQRVDFGKMSGTGTPANGWLNWDREYEYWKEKGFGIDATIMFNSNTFPDSLWKNTVKESYDYGRSFASHFVKNKNLIHTVEIGNEPWDYSKATYRKILSGMAKGIRSQSGGVTLLPCAVQAYDKYSDQNNYISGYISPEVMPLLSGLNTHIYNYVFNEAGKRVAIPPEDPRAAVWSVNNLRRFIDSNCPKCDVYVTEFGYDSDGGGENCTHSECVSETQQAAYGVRTAMILWRLGVKRMYWYFFANVDYASFMHNRSGLTASYANKFKKKKAFIAFEKMQKLIGAYRFEKVLSENNELYAYLLKNPHTGEKAVIAWRPLRAQTDDYTPVALPLEHPPRSVTPVTGQYPFKTTFQKGMFHLKLSGIPLIVKY